MLRKSTPTTDGHDRLVALVSTDVKSSTAATYTDEIAVLQDIKNDRLTLTQYCEHYGGHVWASLGDGLVLSFKTVGQALLCAAQFQHYSFQQRQRRGESRGESRGISHRIGIHLGEFNPKRGLNNQVVLIGDQLQHQAEPGGICCSRTVYDALQLKHDLPINPGDVYALAGVDQSLKLYHYPKTQASQFKHIEEKLQTLNFDFKAVELLSVVFTTIDSYETHLFKNQNAIHQQIDDDFQLMRQRSLNYNARCIKLIGGSSLWVFESAIQAVDWAMKVQRSLHRTRTSDESSHHRIAIHLGDVVWDGKDISGTTVNWASRLLKYIPSGGIGLSASVYDAVYPLLSLKDYSTTSNLVPITGLPHLCRIYTLEKIAKAVTVPNQIIFETPSQSSQNRSATYANAQDVQQAYEKGIREFIEKDFQAFDFQRMSFVNADFSLSCLRQIQGTQLNLTGSKFSRSQLQNANLTGAQLSQAYLNYANLENANLSKANLQGAHLSNANLRGANLQGANLQGAKVTDLQLSMAHCDNTTLYPDGRTRPQATSQWKKIWQKFASR